VSVNEDVVSVELDTKTDTEVVQAHPGRRANRVQTLGLFAVSPAR
jgi:hypothetical protein